MELNNEQKDILYDYTDDLSVVKTITYRYYTTGPVKETSKLLEENHIIWFHEDPGNMYLVPRKK